jgi:hypothetical protein
MEDNFQESEVVVEGFRSSDMAGNAGRKWRFITQERASRPV